MSLRRSKQKILRILGHYFLYRFLNILCRSLKIEKQNIEVIEALESKKQNYVIAFWHGTMLLPWYLHGKTGFAALTSKSKDGDLLAEILIKWNYEVIRGSSSSGGETALGIMIDYIKSNYSIAITPDGPRGPGHVFKAGAVIAAKKSKVPLVLAGVGFRKKRVLNNWDKTEIPSFFTEAHIIYSEPVYVDENLEYEETSELILQCGTLLNELQEKAGKFN